MKPRVARSRRGTWFWLAPVLIGALLAWQLAAELIEPHWLLAVGDRLRSKAPPFEAAAVGGTVLRLYGDTRPHIGKIAGLQKGLVWMQQGKELVEEGYGLGCPIVESGGHAYVSSRAEIAMASQGDVVTLTKRFIMDSVDTPVQLLRRKFRSVPSLGVATVRYEIRTDGTIGVTVDLSELKEGWDRAYLMNELGARHFTHYHDASGADLPAERIGIWEVANVRRGCFDSADSELGFCVEADGPVRLYFGRERTRLYNWRGMTSLSWAGIDLEIPGSQSHYAYQISLSAVPAR